MRKNRLRFAWLLAILGAVFLLAGLLVMVFATVPLAAAPLAPETQPSAWVTLADRVMDFTLSLLQVDWTPARVGVFLIIIGAVLEGSAGYLFLKK